MHTVEQFFAAAFRVTRTCKALWVYQAIPSLFFAVSGTLLSRYYISPLFREYRTLSESNTLDTKLIEMLQTIVPTLFYASVPFVAVGIVLAIVCRTAQYALIAQCSADRPVSLRMGLSAGFRFFWIISGLLITMTVMIAAAVLGGSAAGIFGGASSTGIILSLLIQCILVFFIGALSIYAWPAVVIRGQAIAAAFMMSIRLTLRNAWPVSIILAGILLIELVLLCLFGAALGIGYYINPIAGSTCALLLFLLFIPVRVYMRSVYCLSFIGLTNE